MAEDKSEEKYEKVMKNYREAKNWRGDFWDDNALQACKYYYGDQWSAKNKDLLRKWNRSPSVYNNVLPVIDLIVGHELQGKADLLAKPVDRFADVKIASIITSIIKAIENTNNIQLERRFQFLDGLLTGFGICEKWYDTDEDIEGELKVKQASPFHFYLDINFEKYDYSDAKKLWKETWLTKEDIDDMTSTLEEGQSDDSPSN